MEPPRLPSPLRVVLFDAGNTLLRMDYEAIAGHLAGLGVPAPPREVERAEWRARVRLDAELGGQRRSTEARETGLRYVALLLSELGITSAEVVAAVSAWRAAYNPPVGLWTRPAQGAMAALHAVRSAGAVAAVVSNSDGTVRSLLDRLGLGDGLAFVLDSHEVGVEKPDPRIFQLALGRAGAAPSEAAHIGDLYSVDVLGARAAGLRGVLLDPGGCWPPRDCPVAPDALAAVRLLLGQSGSETNG
jgi:putative hydrolase of the HAD superfamily